MPLPSRAFIHACGHFWRVSRVSLNGLKRERLLVAGNKALVVMHSRVKLALIALTPRGGKGGWLLSLSYVNERSAVGKISTVLAFKSLSSVKRLIEKCIVYIYGRFIVTRFWTGTLSGLNCLTAWWGRRRSCDSFFTPLFSRRSEKRLGNASAIRGYKLRK